MLFEPPYIENIKDVLPIIQENPAFVVKEKDWYTVIDYMYMDDKMFHDPIERECRGLKFNTATGKIIARPYHKFHNLNERPAFATDKVDLTQPHIILDKLDGSMVHTCASSMGIYLMTRMGITHVAEAADKFLCANPVKYSRLFNALPVDDYTYIFEYVAPTNKIVLHYEEEDLILTAIRNNKNGTYVFHDELEKLSEMSGVSLVPAIPSKVQTDTEGLANRVSKSTDTEGVVIRFDTGEMIKIKADEYVRKHRSKDLVGSYKGIVDLIVNKTLDDVLPQLDSDVANQCSEYNETVMKEVRSIAWSISQFTKVRSEQTQKDFALDVQKVMPKPLQSVCFLHRRGCDAFEETLNLIRKNLGTNKRVEELFTALRIPLWTFKFFAEE